MKIDELTDQNINSLNITLENYTHNPKDRIERIDKLEKIMHTNNSNNYDKYLPYENVRRVRNISIDLDSSIHSKEVINEFPKRFLPVLNKNSLFQQFNTIKNSFLKNTNREYQNPGQYKNYTHEKIIKKFERGTIQ